MGKDTAHLKGEMPLLLCDTRMENTKSSTEIWTLSHNKEELPSGSLTGSLENWNGPVLGPTLISTLLLFKPLLI